MQGEHWPNVPPTLSSFIPCVARANASALSALEGLGKPPAPCFVFVSDKSPHSHFAIQFAKGLGCDEVVAFSHSSRKKEDAFKLGADRFVETGEKGFELPLQGTLDIIIVSTTVVSLLKSRVAHLRTRLVFY